MSNTSESKIYDLMLCGGGVIGLSIAYQCARHGWSVLVVESGRVGRGASWAGAGILPAGATLQALDPIEQLRGLSHQLYPQWSRDLLELTGIDNEFRRCGGLYLARTPAERATLAANRMWWDEHGIRYEAWSGQQLLEKVPAIAQHASTGLERKDNVAWYLPEDCRVRNPRHILALVAACQKLGVEIIEQTPVDRFQTDQNRVVAAWAGDQVFLAQRYCITSGAWASQLVGSLGIETGILPVRGQMVLFKLPQPPFSMVVNDGHRYLVPRDDGHVLAGSCEEEVGFDPSTTDEMINQLKSWAFEVCPMLESAPIEQTWAGLRPGSFDTLPYLGTLYPLENAMIAAGHFRHGLHWSTGTAVLMHQWMTGQPTSIDLYPFRVQRGRTLSQA